MAGELVTAISEAVDAASLEELREMVASAVEREPGWPLKPPTMTPETWWMIRSGPWSARIVCREIARQGREMLTQAGDST